MISWQVVCWYIRKGSFCIGSYWFNLSYDSHRNKTYKLIIYLCQDNNIIIIRPVQSTAYLKHPLTCYSRQLLSITEVYSKSALAPMNKFVCKLHGYIVYLSLQFMTDDSVINSLLIIQLSVYGWSSRSESTQQSYIINIPILPEAYISIDQKYRHFRKYRYHRKYRKLSNSLKKRDRWIMLQFMADHSAVS